MKMLIVDDSKAMRTYLQSLAAELAFQTEEAEDGRAGLNKLINNDPREPFAVALVDWEMPVMNGLELVRTVRGNRDFNEVKLMMVSKLNTPGHVAKALAAGADDYLMKPVTKELLGEKLQILGMV
jgi:two-component system chemotaxis response regulator CheY